MQLFLLQLINLSHHYLLQITFLAHKLSIEELFLYICLINFIQGEKTILKWQINPA